MQSQLRAAIKQVCAEKKSVRM